MVFGFFGFFWYGVFRERRGYGLEGVCLYGVGSILRGSVGSVSSFILGFIDGGSSILMM